MCQWYLQIREIICTCDGSSITILATKCKWWVFLKPKSCRHCGSSSDTSPDNDVRRRSVQPGRHGHFRKLDSVRHFVLNQLEVLVCTIGTRNDSNTNSLCVSSVRTRQQGVRRVHRTRMLKAVSAAFQSQSAPLTSVVGGGPQQNDASRQQVWSPL